MKPLPEPKKLAFLNKCHVEYKVYLYNDTQNWHEAFDGTYETLEEAKDFLARWYPELPQSHTAIAEIQITKTVL